MGDPKGACGGLPFIGVTATRTRASNEDCLWGPSKEDCLGGPSREDWRCTPEDWRCGPSKEDCRCTRCPGGSKEERRTGGSNEGGDTDMQEAWGPRFADWLLLLSRSAADFPGGATLGLLMGVPPRRGGPGGASAGGALLGPGGARMRTEESRGMPAGIPGVLAPVPPPGDRRMPFVTGVTTIGLAGELLTSRARVCGVTDVTTDKCSVEAERLTGVAPLPRPSVELVRTRCLGGVGKLTDAAPRHEEGTAADPIVDGAWSETAWREAGGRRCLAAGTGVIARSTES